MQCDIWFSNTSNENNVKKNKKQEQCNLNVMATYDANILKNLANRFQENRQKS